ncbi:rod shape-determining protein RodA [Segatella oris]|jgi:putative rod shape-determining protein rodA|uniref:Cell wall polymerase n=2 Tax=Segatella oris TaxID=28135 RepID=D1QNQ3_9BACT|nr:rod shape-determining protein RodA [Segatella oris]EFB33005.1 cell cycle protein, FtsW/RodA/SpoVE family [Segatella oris F0302]MBF1449064.1 rod shape-determining protein RodA [Segatella oris]OFP38879.1 rod shape-determining protein RodA [Prevotella sp. HMSC069G02]VEH16263.1 Rod shape-determining protein RodA [Segatella oris]
MVRTTDKQPSVLRSLDWWTVGIYIALLVFGWVSVCGASYTYGDTDIFSLSTRSGMQIVWIGTSLFLGLVLLLLDDRFYDTFSYVIYAILLLLLFLTIFNPHEIKGSRSWLVLGPLRLQPAEFAKFATALAVAKLMGSYGFNIHHWKDFVAACGVVLLPMLFIVAQKETGSALVYLSFFLMFYREGMPGSILFTGVAMVVYFVVGIKFEGVSLLQTPTSLGVFVVILLIQTFTSVMVNVYCRNKKLMWYMLGGSFGATLLALLFSLYVIPFNIIWVQLLVTVIIVGYLLVEWLRTRLSNYFFILAFAIGSIAFFYSADYVLNNVLEPHQRVRINVLLGLDDDLSGAGYNVHQSEIAIGSGGLRGKGFLNGTQTKLKFVPEQDTDFIFCTVGEEEGFFGSAGVLILFLLLILRLIHLAERQPFAFGRIYGYCVLSIFLFHVFINVGMVLGLTPVIGIPLPFFSYGGSSLWGFTFLLFIFLRIDAGRNLVRIE